MASNFSNNRQSLIDDAAADAANSSIESRCVADSLDMLAAIMDRQIADNVIDMEEIKTWPGMIRLLARLARELREAADMSANAANKCEIADQRFKGILRQDLSNMSAHALHGAFMQALFTLVQGDPLQEAQQIRERMAGLVILSDYQQPTSPRAA